MPENEGKSLGTLPWAPLLALLAAVAGVAALLPSPSARPPASGDGAGTNAVNEVSARLWQDPIGVARESLHYWQKSAAPETSNVVDLIKAYAAQAYGGPRTTLPPEETNELTKAYAKLYSKPDSKNTPPVVLIVAEPNSPYAEDVERRVRDRAAVLHALSAEGYLPEDSTTLHYATVKNEDPETTPEGVGASSIPSKRPPEVLPYEVFHSLNPGETKPDVLVVWLADGVVSNRGLLIQLVWIAKPLAEISRKKPGNLWPQIKVLGPSTSEQYRKMLENAEDVPASCPPLENLAATTIFSCKASAPEEAFTAAVRWLNAVWGKRQNDPAVQRRKAKFTEDALTERLRSPKFGAFGFHLTRTICADDQLMTVLWDELKQRGISNNADVAAIAELDSFYGFTTATAFLRSRPDSYQEGKPFDFQMAGRNAKHVHIYSYMAGIDGALPKSALGVQEEKTKEADSAAKTSPSFHEPTEGASQVDYLRRLARQLNQKNRDMTARHRELDAVAVLGSDIYDKLQILRTLRPELSRAVFMTNNLDARFGHPDEWDETRNLLVASNYDLTPREDWKTEHRRAKPGEAKPGAKGDPSQEKKRSLNEIPPFRDSTQAAVYAATRFTFADKKEAHWRGRPMLFVVGRDGPVRLEPAKRPRPKDVRHNFDAKVWKLVRHAFRHHHSVRDTMYKAICCVGASVLLAKLLWGDPPTRAVERISDQPLHPVQKSIVRLFEPEGRWHQTFFYAGVMVPASVLVGLGAVAFWHHAQGNAGKEPFGLTNGISIWPGDFFRVCIVLLAGYFALKIVYDLRINALLVEKDLCIIDPEKDRPLVDKQPGWGGLWRNFWPQAETYDDGNGRIDVRQLWLRYQTWTNPGYRYLRAALLWLLYTTALMCLLGLFNLPLDRLLPVRGPTAGFSNFLVWLSSLSALYVTFLVVDATELNHRSIADLHKKRSNWHMRDLLRLANDSELRGHLTLLEAQDCADYLDIEMIARRSEAVNKLVYYPFILLTLTVMGRWRWTDDYQWSAAFLIGIGLHLAVAVYCAIRLPVVAEKARQKSLGRLRQKLFERRVYEARGRKFFRSSVSAIEQVIAEIETMNRGAFVGIWEQPVLRAVLVPSGGVGLGALLSLFPH